MSETTNVAVLQPRLRESLDKARPEMAKVAQDGLLPINTDPFTAASIARAALPQIMTLRAQLEKLPDFDVQLLDKIELYALATLQAQNLYLASSAPPAHLQELVAEATVLRETLLSDVTALANRGFMNLAELDTLKGPVGHRNVASDVMTLATMIRFNWDRISGKTAITMAEIDRAELLGEQLSFDIGQKTTSPAVVAAVALERQQAFTLLGHAYDQVRRAVSFIRWNEDDVDDIAPSFYAGRKKRSGTDAKPNPEPEPEPAKSEIVSNEAAPAPATTATRPGVGLPGADLPLSTKVGDGHGQSQLVLGRFQGN